MGSLLVGGTFGADVVEFTNTEGEFAELFQETWRQVFPTCRLQTFRRAPLAYGKKPYLRTQVVSRHVIAFLQSLGLKGPSGEREVPEAILQSPQSVAAAFLQGLYEGDGAVERSGRTLLRVALCAKNRRLLRQVQTLLLRFGIVATLHEEQTHGRCRLLILGQENLRRFADRIGFVSQAKQDALTDALSRHSGRTRSHTEYAPFLSEHVRANATRHREWFSNRNFDRPGRLMTAVPRLQAALAPEGFDEPEERIWPGYLFEQVVAIEEAGEHPVYSVRVDSACHSFVANGFVNHNTEVRMSPLAMEMLADIDKNTVDFVPNYDQSRQEPVVLPARFPNLLANGCSGIAVGMATNIPPHNLSELVDAIILWIDNPNATVDELMEKLPGPDFPTAGLILGKKGIRQAYETGRGAVTMQAKTQIEPMDGGKHAIVITELPYQVNKARLIEQIAELVKARKVDGITDINDFTDKHGMRVVIELRRDAHPQRILNYLLKHTPLRTNFGVLMLALVDGQPKILSLSQVIGCYVKHRQEIVRRRTEFDLEAAKRRAHIVEGLLKAIDVIDEIIRIIRASRTVEIARKELMETFAFTEVQAQAILEMQLQRLVNLERQKLQEEYRELLQKIAYLEGVLADPAKVLAILKEELRELKRKYGDPRRTRIVPIEADEIGEEDTIPEEETIVTITRNGYIKRVAADTYRVQRRGGRGVLAATSKEEDEIAHLFVATTHHYILFFTDRGRVYRLKAYEVPQASRQAMGTAIINLISIEPGEAITATVPLKTLDGEGFLVMGTERGEVKRSSLSEFQNLRANGLRAFDLEENDSLRWVLHTDGRAEIFLATAQGQAIRFPETELRAAGRAAGGVRGITLAPGDRVIGMQIAHPDCDMLVVSENGYGKRTPLREYPTHHRGGKGLYTMRVTPKTGPIADIRVVGDDDRLLIITAGGIVIRVRVSEIRRIGRATEGVRLINLAPEDRVVSIERVAAKHETETEGADAGKPAQPALRLDSSDGGE